MKSFLLYLFTVLLLLGCASVNPMNGRELQLGTPGETSLWKLTIGTGDRIRYTGLLALASEAEWMTAILLDGTGIKLIEERIYLDGIVETLFALPAVRQQGLPSYLGQGLFKLFMEWRSPVVGFHLTHFCLASSEAGLLTKTKKIGPFRLWTAVYVFKNPDGAGEPVKATLDLLWPVPDLNLTRL
ncbi:MAG: hypothetical protein KJ950_00655 [Proteobacteria bacterium]|nr:hypothetical protein [Pseudomonadota bacterium]MBU1685863.1 hypothetical protein [Pseudomonadota bacterium]